MSQLSSLKDIQRLYATHGALNYGEGVTQMEHALQCAALGERAGCPPSLVAACLMHDIGHLFEKEDEVTGAITDHRHELRGANALAVLFTEAVWRPVALHVGAKRYLCFREYGYRDTLSPASQHSLELQGGAFHAAEAATFEALPYWQEAVTLRRFDDMGKREQLSLRAFEEFMPLLKSVMLDSSRDK